MSRKLASEVSVALAAVGCAAGSLPSVPSAAASSTSLTAKSGLQIRQVSKVIERLRVGERIDVFHGQTVNDVADRKLGELPRQRSRQVGYVYDLRGHVSRCCVRADRIA